MMQASNSAKPHHLLAVGVVEAIVPPGERDRLAAGCNDGDGDPMGVTGQTAAPARAPRTAPCSRLTHLMRRSGAMKR
jgi:hypothetical protein